MKEHVINDFKELRVYRRAFRQAMHLFELSKTWPKEERHSRTDQVRRASRGVCSNLAEAWLKRRYPKHFVSKISDTGGEAAEVLVWLDFAAACGYLDAGEADRLAKDYRRIIGGLVKMMAKPTSWCAPSSLIKEEEALYEL
jgi:four helix bundle protein